MMAVCKQWVCWAWGIGICVTGLVGCPTTTDCADPRNAEACGKEKVAVLVTVSSTVARMRAEEEVELSATLERTGEWPSQGEVILSARDLIAGVTIEPVQVATDATEATLRFVADKVVPQGAFVFKLAATPVDARIPSSEVALEVVVAGPPGTPDLSFGGDGEIRISTPGVKYVVYDVELDPDGNLIVAGSREANAKRTAVLMKIALSGEVDAAFSEAFPVTKDETYTAVLDVGVTEEGLLVLAEASDDASNLRVRLIKYDLQGRLDRTFGENGGTLFEGSSDFYGFDIAWRDNDILVVEAGGIQSFSHGGVKNESFGDGGIFVFSSLFEPKSSIRRGDGVIFVHSLTQVWVVTDEGAALYASDLDDLAERIPVDSEYQSSTTIFGCDFVSEDLLCLGSFFKHYSTPPAEGAWLARVRPDGTLDPTFGNAGLVTRFDTIDAATSNSAVAPLGANQFLLREVDRGTPAEYLARYNPDGSRDAVFGDAGRAQVAIGSLRKLPIDQRRGRVVQCSENDGVITITRYWL